MWEKYVFGCVYVTLFQMAEEFNFHLLLTWRQRMERNTGSKLFETIDDMKAWLRFSYDALERLGGMELIHF